MDASEHEAKFMDCARRSLDETRARAVLELLGELDRVPEVGLLIRAAVPQDDASNPDCANEPDGVKNTDGAATRRDATAGTNE